MSNYAAEPVPSEIDPVLAEFLNRQLNAIQLSFMSQFIAPQVGQIPDRVIPGAIINLRDPDDESKNGFYCCEVDGQGEGRWMRIQTTIPL